MATTTKKDTSNMKIWESLNRPPASALKPIIAGRLKGKSDINPQWRLQALTEKFGPCGIGWKYEIVNMWLDPGSDGQVVANVHINLFVKENEEWSALIPGVGGNTTITKEKSGLYTNDEAYKMALTDAISVAAKALGLAADIYMGLWDGSKYSDRDISVPDESKIADWLAACDEAATGPIEEYRKWYNEHVDQIKRDCGTVGAADVYKRFVDLGKAATHAKS